MAVLDDIKVLLDIPDTSKDAKLNLYIRKATTLIAQYLNIPTITITDIYKEIVISIGTKSYPNMPVETTTDNGITTTSQPPDILLTYPDAVIEYVIICMNKRGNEGIKQSSQGSRSQTYANDLPDSVKALLPMPYVSMLPSRRRYGGY